MSLSFLNGVFDLPWWGYVLVTLGLTHITIASVTIFLHRHQAHRALELHPIPSHFFRFWLWLTTGMVTKQWAAIHRKHHAKCETADDPHSPQVLGIKKVFWEGAELYRRESSNAETMERYGHGTPDDWIERNVYSRDRLGVSIMLITNLVLFGPVGLAIWAVQMIWIPLFAAGVINGVGHYWGYRNFAAEDASRNIVPWGILIGGEELHNNHHAYASSARLSNKWFEFDIGWAYIRMLEIVGLAKVKKLAPKVQLDLSKAKVDLGTLQAIVTNRYEVVTRFTRAMRATWSGEMDRIKTSPGLDKATVRRWLNLEARALGDQDRARLNEALSKSKVMATVYSMRQDLSGLWQRSAASKEQLVKQLEDWCRRADASGIRPLQEFSRQLRAYA
ncbi:MAG: fatty acid desaturase [Rhodocyclaceae bacterium]|nr:fatty acid desaturase [Rhodocyclaceae bacterium]MCA3145671.1 fatty acid desaturase [Rhodocyclaceae bacterium]